MEFHEPNYYRRHIQQKITAPLLIPAAETSTPLSSSMLHQTAKSPVQIHSSLNNIKIRDLDCMFITIGGRWCLQFKSLDSVSQFELDLGQKDWLNLSENLWKFLFVIEGTKQGNQIYIKHQKSGMYLSTFKNSTRQDLNLYLSKKRDHHAIFQICSITNKELNLSNGYGHYNIPHKLKHISSNKFLGINYNSLTLIESQDCLDGSEIVFQKFSSNTKNYDRKQYLQNGDQILIQNFDAISCLGLQVKQEIFGFNAELELEINSEYFKKSNLVLTEKTVPELNQSNIHNFIWEVVKMKYQRLDSGVEIRTGNSVIFRHTMANVYLISSTRNDKNRKNLKQCFEMGTLCRLDMKQLGEKEIKHNALIPRIVIRNKNQYAFDEIEFLESDEGSEKSVSSQRQTLQSIYIQDSLLLDNIQCKLTKISHKIDQYLSIFNHYLISFIENSASLMLQKQVVVEKQPKSQLNTYQQRINYERLKQLGIQISELLRMIGQQCKGENTNNQVYYLKKCLQITHIIIYCFKKQTQTEDFHEKFKSVLQPFFTQFFHLIIKIIYNEHFNNEELQQNIYINQQVTELLSLSPHLLEICYDQFLIFLFCMGYFWNSSYFAHVILENIEYMREDPQKWLAIAIELVKKNSNSSQKHISGIMKHLSLQQEYTNNEIRFKQKKFGTQFGLTELKLNKQTEGENIIKLLLVSLVRNDHSFEGIIKFLSRHLYGAELQYSQSNNDQILEEEMATNQNKLILKAVNTSNTLVMLLIFQQYFTEYVSQNTTLSENRQFIFVDKPDISLQEKQKVEEMLIKEKESSQSQVNVLVNSQSENNENSRQSLQSLMPVSKIFNWKIKESLKQISNSAPNSSNSTIKHDFIFYNILNFSSQDSNSAMDLMQQFHRKKVSHQLMKIVYNFDFQIKTVEEYVSIFPLLKFHEDSDIFVKINKKIEEQSKEKKKLQKKSNELMNRKSTGIFDNVLNSLFKVNQKSMVSHLSKTHFHTNTIIKSGAAQKMDIPYLHHFYLMNVLLQSVLNTLHAIVTFGYMDFEGLNQIELFVLEILAIMLGLPNSNINLINFKKCSEFMQECLKEEEYLRLETNQHLIYLIRIDETLKTINNLLDTVMSTKIRLNAYPCLEKNTKEKLFQYGSFYQKYHEFLTLPSQPLYQHLISPSFLTVLPIIKKSINFYLSYESSIKISVIYRGLGSWPWKSSYHFQNLTKHRPMNRLLQTGDPQSNRAFMDAEYISEQINQLGAIILRIDNEHEIEGDISVNINRAKQMIEKLKTSIKNFMRRIPKQNYNRTESKKERIGFDSYEESAIKSFEISESLASILLRTKLQFQLQGPILQFLCSFPPRIQIFSKIESKLNYTQETVKILASSLKRESIYQEKQVNLILIQIIKQGRYKMPKQLFITMLGLIVEIYPNQSLCVRIYETLLELVKESKIFNSSKKSKESLMLYKNMYSNGLHLGQCQQNYDENKSTYPSHIKKIEKQSSKINVFTTICLSQYISSYKTVETFRNYLHFLSSVPPTLFSNQTSSIKNQLSYINKFITLLFRLCLVSNKVSHHFTQNIIKYDSLFQIAFCDQIFEASDGLGLPPKQGLQPEKFQTRIPYQYKIPTTIFFRSDKRIPQDQVVLHDYMIWISKVLKQYKKNSQGEQIKQYIWKNNLNYYNFHLNASSKQKQKFNKLKFMGHEKITSKFYENYFSHYVKKSSESHKNIDEILENISEEVGACESCQYWDMLYHQPFHYKEEGLLVFLEDIAMNIRDTQHILYSNVSFSHKSSHVSMKEKIHDSIFQIYEYLYGIIRQFQKQTFHEQIDEEGYEELGTQLEFMRNFDIGNQVVQKCRKIILILREKFPKLKAIPNNGEMSPECIAYNIISCLLKNKLLIKFIKIFYYNQYKSINNESQTFNPYFETSQKQQYDDSIGEISNDSNSLCDEQLSFKNSRSSKIQNFCSKDSIRMTEKYLEKNGNTNKQISIKDFIKFEVSGSELQQDEMGHNQSSQGLVRNNIRSLNRINYLSKSETVKQMKTGNTIHLNLNKHHHFSERQYMFYEVIKLLKKVCDYKENELVYLTLEDYFIEFYEHAGPISALTKQILGILALYRNELINQNMEQAIFFSAGYYKEYLVPQTKSSSSLDSMKPSVQISPSVMEFLNISKKIEYFIENNQLELAMQTLKLCSLCQRSERRQNLALFVKIVQKIFQKNACVKGLQKYLPFIRALSQQFLCHTHPKLTLTNNLSHLESKVSEVTAQYIFRVVMSIQENLKYLKGSNKNANIKQPILKKKNTCITINHMMKGNETNGLVVEHDEKLEMMVVDMVKVYGIIEKYLVGDQIKILGIITNTQLSAENRLFLYSSPNLIEICSRYTKVECFKIIIHNLLDKYSYNPKTTFPNIFQNCFPYKISQRNKNRQQNYFISLIKQNFDLLFLKENDEIIGSGLCEEEDFIRWLTSTNIQICQALHVIGLFYEYLHAILWDSLKNSMLTQSQNSPSEKSKAKFSFSEDEEYGYYNGLPYVKAMKEHQNIKVFFMKRTKSRGNDRLAKLQNQREELKQNLLRQINLLIGFANTEQIWQYIGMLEFYLIITVKYYSTKKKTQEENLQTKRNHQDFGIVIAQQRFSYLKYLLELSLNIHNLKAQLLKTKIDKKKLIKKEASQNLSLPYQMTTEIDEFLGIRVFNEQFEYDEIVSEYSDFFKKLSHIPLKTNIQQTEPTKLPEQIQLRVLYTHLGNLNKQKSRMILENYPIKIHEILQDRKVSSNPPNPLENIRSLSSFCLHSIDLQYQLAQSDSKQPIQRGLAILRKQEASEIFIFLSILLSIIYLIVGVFKYTGNQIANYEVSSSCILLILNALLLMMLLYNKISGFILERRLEESLFKITEMKSLQREENEIRQSFCQTLKHAIKAHFFVLLFIASQVALSIFAIFQPILTPFLILLPIIFSSHTDKKITSIPKEVIFLSFTFWVFLVCLFFLVGTILSQFDSTGNITYISRVLDNQNPHLQFLFLFLSKPIHQIYRFQGTAQMLIPTILLKILMVILFLSFIGNILGRLLVYIKDHDQDKQKKRSKKDCLFCLESIGQSKNEKEEQRIHAISHDCSRIILLLKKLLRKEPIRSYFDQKLVKQIQNESFNFIR